MAIGDISAFSPIILLPTTSLGTIPLASNEEITFRFVRAVCLVASGGTPPTVSVGVTSSCNELCFNEVVPIPSASVSGAKNILGPDFITLPPNSSIYYRASASGAVKLIFTGTRKQVS